MPDANGRPLFPAGAAEQQLRRLTRRSFVVGGAAALAGLGAARWLATATPKDGLPWPLRGVLRFNQELAERLWGLRTIRRRLSPPTACKARPGPTA